MKINNLSIIFQGFVDEKIAAGIRRSVFEIKKINPDVKIILSTWDSCKFTYIANIEIIRSSDLESYTPIGYKQNNLHKQILSTNNGIENVKTEFSLKIRTDIEIVDAEILLKKLFRNLVSARNFKNKIGVLTYSSVDPLRTNLPLLYHPCDWIYFGRTLDLKKLFSCPIPKNDYFDGGVKFKYFDSRFADYAESMRSEEYIGSYSMNINHWKNVFTNINPTKFSIIRSNMQMANNFYFNEIDEIGLKSNKHITNKLNFARFNKFSQYLWLNIPKDGIYRKIRKIMMSLFYVQSDLRVFYKFFVK